LGFDPNLATYPLSPKNFSDGEHKKQMQWPGHQQQQPDKQCQLGQPADRVTPCQPKPVDASCITDTPAGSAEAGITTTTTTTPF
jgi:hypothetical protein